MEAFVRETGVAAPLFRTDIDTDQIIPIREMVDVVTDNYADGLFANWRYIAKRQPNPDFILNREPWSKATILLAGRNFGCGSSRELAPRALRDFGFRAIVAPSFSRIFYGNCFRNGILPVELPEDVVAALSDLARQESPPPRITVDLQSQTLTSPSGEVHSFTVPPTLRQMLLEGNDEIDITLKRSAEIEAYAQADRAKRPWVHCIDRPEPAGAPATQQ